MIEINLLPDVKQEFVRSRRLKRVVVASAILTSIVAAGIVALLVFYVFAVQPGREYFLDQSIKSRASELEKNKNLTRDLTLQNQLVTVTELHEDKGVYSRLFDYLRILNPQEPNNISISQASLDTATGTLSIEASAKNFPAVSIFQDTLNNAKLSYTDPATNEPVKVDMFSDVQITETGLGQDSTGAQVTSFKALLTYEPNAFAWGINNPVLSVPNEDTTPSASRVNVFADKPLKQVEVQQ